MAEVVEPLSVFRELGPSRVSVQFCPVPDKRPDDPRLALVRLGGGIGLELKCASGAPSKRNLSLGYRSGIGSYGLFGAPQLWEIGHGRNPPSYGFPQGRF